MGLGIGIAGAGIGGLATAALLADRGHRVAVFDRFDAPRPVGSGLILQPVGLEVLRRIGAAEAALWLGAPITRLRGLECRTGHGVLALLSWTTAPHPVGAGCGPAPAASRIARARKEGVGRRSRATAAPNSSDHMNFFSKS